MKFSLDVLPFELGEDIQSEVPDVPYLISRGIQGSKSLVDASWRVSTLFTNQVAAQRVIGTIGHTIGFVLPNELDAVRNALLQPLVKIAIEIAEDLQQFVEDVVGMAISMASDIAAAVPIINIIAEIVFSIVKLVREGVQEGRNLPREQGQRLHAQDPQQMSPQMDAMLFNGTILNIVTKTKDWTKIFLPSGSGKPDLRWIKGHSKDSQIAVPGGADWMTHGTGSVPGTSTLLHGWQYNSSTGEFVPTGDFFPTARNAGIALWQQISKPSSPAMFCVDALAISAKWTELFINLTEYLKVGSLHGSRGSPREVLPSTNLLQYLWKQYSSVFGGSRKGFGDYGLANTKPLRAARILHANQIEALKDPVCAAYMDSTYGAIQGDPYLKQRMQEGQRALVEGVHDVMLVEPDMIPMTSSDAFAFKAAILQMQAKKKGPRFQGPSQLAPEDETSVTRRRIFTSVFQQPEVSTPTPPPEVHGVRPSSELSGAKIASLLALGGLGYLISTRRK